MGSIYSFTTANPKIIEAMNRTENKSKVIVMALEAYLERLNPSDSDKAVCNKLQMQVEQAEKESLEAWAIYDTKQRYLKLLAEDYRKAKGNYEGKNKDFKLPDTEVKEVEEITNAKPKGEPDGSIQ